MIGMLIDRADLPKRFADIGELESFMARPTQELIDDLAAVPGDILVLGAGGKMGPTLSMLARHAAPDKRVVAVARFSEQGLRERLERHGIETIACDLLDRKELARLPSLANLIFMAGRKFGSSEDESLTWVMNVILPAMVAETFTRSRIVAFSTGCVYPFVDVTSGGSTEEFKPHPAGRVCQFLRRSRARYRLPFG